MAKLVLIGRGSEREFINEFDNFSEIITAFDFIFQFGKNFANFIFDGFGITNFIFDGFGIINGFFFELSKIRKEFIINKLDKVFTR